jgi:hypothetical protein
MPVSALAVMPVVGIGPAVEVAPFVTPGTAKSKRGRPKKHVTDETAVVVEPRHKKASMTSTLGTFCVSEGVRGVDVVVAGDGICGREDSFRISIPNAQREEFFI